jgi:hypothetical protein
VEFCRNIIRTIKISFYEIATNGNTVYALWTEDCISYLNDLEPDDEGTENPANISMERHIFAAGQICEGEKKFPWSKPIQVTLDAGENYSQLSFVVPADNQFLAAYARSRKTYDEAAGHFTDNEAIRTLAVNEFTITNDLELGEIEKSTDYPLAGATVDATALYEIEWVPQTGSENPAYLLGGDSIPLRASFVMSETLDGVEQMVIGFNVKNEADEQLATIEKVIQIAPDMQLKVKECELTSTDSATVNLYAENNGNHAQRLYGLCTFAFSQ